MNTNTPPAAKIAQMGNSAWMLVLRGVVAILFGALAIAWPDLTLVWLVALFAVYALLGGGVSITVALRSRHIDRKWGLPLLLGIVSIVAGVYAIAYPGLTAFALVLVMGVNALFTGALDIAIAIRFRKILRGPWLLVLSGVLSLLFGSLVIAAPGPRAGPGRVDRRVRHRDRRAAAEPGAAYAARRPWRRAASHAGGRRSLSASPWWTWVDAQGAPPAGRSQ